MSAESLLVILLVGLIAGWLAGQIVQGTGFRFGSGHRYRDRGGLNRKLVATAIGHSPRHRHCCCCYLRDDWCPVASAYSPARVQAGPMVSL